jgi:hypothetical protein
MSTNNTTTSEKLTFSFDIKPECHKALKELWKQTDKKVKPEYHNLHFMPDGYVYFATYQAILRTKYTDNPKVVEPVCFNLEDFLSLLTGKESVISGTITKDEKDITCKIGKKIIGHSADVKSIRHISKLFYTSTDHKSVDFQDHHKTPVSTIRFLDCFLSQWTINFIHDYFTSSNQILDVKAKGERDVFFVYGECFDMLFVPVSIRNY